MDDAGPGRIHGATITSWNGPPEIDLASLFAHTPSGVSIGGSARTPNPMQTQAPARPATVCLSDGTEITFAGSGTFSVTELV
jgi:hypothetical protein